MNENIMVHAFRPENDADYLVIQINGELDGQEIVLSITDTGIGLTPEQLALLQRAIDTPTPLTNQYHIGLRNIQERIALIYGEGHGLSIYSTFGSGTRITLRIHAYPLAELNELIQH